MAVTGISANRLELLQIANSVAQEKNIDREIVIEALEEAIQKGAKSRYGAHHDIRAKIDPKTGELALTRHVTIVEDDWQPEDELEEFNDSAMVRLTDASKRDPEAVVGKEYVEELPPFEFGRVQTQMARQVITGKVREAERANQYEEFKDRVGEIVNGTVKRVEYGNTIVDLGRGEGIMRRDQSIPREVFNIGDRIRTYIYDVRPEAKGPQVMLSRAHPGFMAKLFAQEVPEVYDGVIEIRAAARDAGSRAKMAVLSNDSSIDPVGACVGMRGSRVQAVVAELQGEKIDIIQWNPDEPTFIVNALAPAEVDDDVAVLDALDRAVDDLADAVLELFVLVGALGVTDLAGHDLAGHLGLHPAELERRQVLDVFLADKGFRIALGGVGQADHGGVVELFQLVFRLPVIGHDGDVTRQGHFARLDVDLGADVVMGTVARLGALLDRFLDRLDDDLLVDVLFARDRIGDRQQFESVRGNAGYSHGLVLGLFRVVITGGALFGTRLHQFVGQHQFGVDQPGEGNEGGVLLPFQIHGDMVAVGPGDHALEPLAALDHAVAFQPRLKALEQVEIRQAGQGAIDAGRGHFQQIFAGDRVGGVEHLRHGAAQAGAFLDGDVVIRRALGHDLQPPAQGAAHQTHAHDVEAEALGHGFDQLQQLAVFGGLGLQGHSLAGHHAGAGG